MAAAATVRIAPASSEPAWLRHLLIALALGFLTLFLVLPLATVFVEALRKGVDAYLSLIHI